MISIFTPSHNPKFLDEAYQSLKYQNEVEWEWIVLLNNEAKWKKPEDERVFVIEYFQPGEDSVGFYKNMAVKNCHGDILVELDHDDMLMPGALKEISDAFEDPEVGFVYSNFSYINEDGSPNISQYDPSYGWRYEQQGGYNVCVSMPVFPHNVSLIWYAPNHVRSFRRSVYEQVGEYNKELRILDDQDLMIRLYRVTKFKHIEKNLYLQRVHPENTQTKEDINPLIQQETVQMHSINIESLMLKWSGDNNLLALDLGGAHNPTPGYKTVDLYEPADYVGDIFDVLGSMEDNSVGVIRAVDFLEHISDKIRLWNEMYRVLAHSGMIFSLTPSTDGRGAYQDPTHVAYYNSNSFWYFVDENYKKFVPELKLDFQVSTISNLFPSKFHEEHNILYVRAHLIANKGGGRIGGKLGI
jgi:glycosyltransferase involved in cell wall biosynthesis